MVKIKKYKFMAHIHEKIDFTVAIFVVHEEKILLIHHRKLDKWLPPATSPVSFTRANRSFSGG